MSSGKSFPPPARGPASFYTEQETVSRLETALLASRRLRTFFLRNDKTPNHDGYFHLDEPDLPCGLLVVQIRGTEDAFLEGAGVHVDLRFCAACDEAALAGVFFHVSLQSKRARWVAIGPSRLLDFKAALQRSGQQFITVSPDGEFSIEGAVPDDTIRQWRALADEHLEAYHRGRTAVSQLQRERLISQRLQLLAVRAHEELPEFESIHDFLDALNYALDGSFRCLKKLVWADAWKVGIAYDQNDADGLSYGLFAVARDANDLLVKRLPSGVLNRVFGPLMPSLTDRKPNPLSRPQEFALEVLREYCKEFLEDLLLYNGPALLIAERLAFLVLRIRDILALPAQGDISLDMLRAAVYRHIKEGLLQIIDQLPSLTEPSEFHTQRIVAGGTLEQINRELLEPRGLPPITAYTIGDVDVVALDAIIERAATQGLTTVSSVIPPTRPDTAALVAALRHHMQEVCASFAEVAGSLFPALEHEFQYPPMGNRLVFLVEAARTLESEGVAPSELVVWQMVVWRIVMRPNDELPSIEVFGPGEWPERYRDLIDQELGVREVSLDIIGEEILSVSRGGYPRHVLGPAPVWTSVVETMSEALDDYFTRLLSEKRAG
jgi:hypothetical protein